MTDVAIRHATLADVPDLVSLENRCFSGDRLSQRSFKYMMTKAHGELWVAVDGATIVGYILVLYHQGTCLSRLYSIAVDASMQGRGVADLLMDKGEACSKEEGCVFMRLEVRADNARAIRLYERRGYRYFGRIEEYYDDGAHALRYEKSLKAKPTSGRYAVPYYSQTTDFTCGPATLMMAMQALNPRIELDRSQELRIWREATTIFMTSGHGGCGPHGLALAAWRRGFRVQMFVNQNGPLFTEGVRNEEKKSVLMLVHDEFERDLQETDVAVEYRAVTSADVSACLAEGGIPLMMISTYQFNRNKAPHWVIVTAMDERFVYIHDPDIDEETFRLETDNINIPIPRAHFDRMSKFGQMRLRTALFIYNRHPVVNNIHDSEQNPELRVAAVR